MLATILVICLSWFLLSLIVGLLAGSAVSAFREAPEPGSAVFPETDGETAPLYQQEEEILVPAHAQM